MSFGYSVGDALSLAQLAWKLVEGARKACGEYDDLTREVLHHHQILSHLSAEIENSESAINKSSKGRQRDLRNYLQDCERQLLKLDGVLEKYNGLGDKERGTRRLWKKVRFGVDGEVQDVLEIRSKIAAYISAISMALQLMSLGSQGRVEERLRQQGGDLKGITQKLNLVVAKLNDGTREGSRSIMTDYKEDDKMFWRTLRRELNSEGCPSVVFDKHKHLIKDYVKELGKKGAFDERAANYSTSNEIGELPNEDENEILVRSQPKNSAVEGSTQLLPQNISSGIKDDENSSGSDIGMLRSRSQEPFKLSNSQADSSNQEETVKIQSDPLNMSSKHCIKSSLSHSIAFTNDISDDKPKPSSLPLKAEVILPLNFHKANTTKTTTPLPTDNSLDGRWILSSPEYCRASNLLDTKARLRSRFGEFIQRYSVITSNEVQPKRIPSYGKPSFLVQQPLGQCNQARKDELDFVSKVQTEHGEQGLISLQNGGFFHEFGRAVCSNMGSSYSPCLNWRASNMITEEEFPGLLSVFSWLRAWTTFIFEKESSEAQLAHESRLLYIRFYSDYTKIRRWRADGILGNHEGVFETQHLLLQKANKIYLLVMEKLTSRLLDLLDGKVHSYMLEYRYVISVQSLLVSEEWLIVKEEIDEFLLQSSYSTSHITLWG